jgi:tRNA 2-thiouridine synthesizing protein C
MSEQQATPGGPNREEIHVCQPQGTLRNIYALESLEVVLITATFDQDVSLVFIDDGVYELVKGQQTKGIGIKNFSPSYRALDGYDVEKLYVDQASLEQRGLTEKDLLVPVEVLDAPANGATHGATGRDPELSEENEFPCCTLSINHPSRPRPWTPACAWRSPACIAADRGRDLRRHRWQRC